MSRPVLQFGTSRFLQAHADLFIHEAREAGGDIGPITVVQTSGAADRAGRVAAFGRPEGYPVLIRGLEDGRPVERQVTVLSVERGLSAGNEWDEIGTLFAGATDFVISNTGDKGYEVAAEDRRPDLLTRGIPASFPGKLAALLHRRWKAGGRRLTVLPCELINRNGTILKETVRRLAAEAGAEPDFLAWLEREVIFADTLVDRIVSEPIEPVGAVAEPYALWAIQRQPDLDAPFEHPSLVMTDDLETFERLKLHILNLGHSVLAEIWTSEGRDPGETVRAILSDPAVADRLDRLYATEVVPGFAARGLEAEAKAYVATVLERFRNPFLDHRLADIAQNHAVKVDRRIKAFLDWIAESGHPPETAVLSALARRHATSA